MKTTKKPAAKAAKKNAAKPAAKIAVTLRVYPHVMQTDINGTEEPGFRVLIPTPQLVAAHKAKHEAAGAVVTVENYGADGKPVS